MIDRNFSIATMMWLFDQTDKEGKMAKEPRVDKESCISCGLCVSFCPEVFRFDADGKSECYDPFGASEENIQKAMDGCPVQCIYWKE